MNEHKIVKNRRPPLGIILITIVYYVSFILGVANLIGGMFSISYNIDRIRDNMLHDKFMFIKNILYDVMFITTVVLYFLLGRNIWLGKKWARILAIILSVIGIADSIYVLLMSPEAAFFANMKAVICILIIAYLLLNKNAIKHFQDSRGSNNNMETGNDKTTGQDGF